MASDPHTVGRLAKMSFKILPLNKVQFYHQIKNNNDCRLIYEEQIFMHLMKQTNDNCLYFYCAARESLNCSAKMIMTQTHCELISSHSHVSKEFSSFFHILNWSALKQIQLTRENLYLVISFLNSVMPRNWMDKMTEECVFKVLQMQIPEEPFYSIQPQEFFDSVMKKMKTHYAALDRSSPSNKGQIDSHPFVADYFANPSKFDHRFNRKGNNVENQQLARDRLATPSELSFLSLDSNSDLNFIGHNQNSGVVFNSGQQAPQELLIPLMSNMMLPVMISLESVPIHPAHLQDQYAAYILLLPNQP